MNDDNVCKCFESDSKKRNVIFFKNCSNGVCVLLSDCGVDSLSLYDFVVIICCFSVNSIIVFDSCLGILQLRKKMKRVPSTSTTTSGPLYRL